MKLLLYIGSAYVPSSTTILPCHYCDSLSFAVQAGATADASKPADPGQASAGSAAGETGSQGGPSASQGAQTAVKSTTMAVRMKNAELVEKLHSLLCELKTPAAAGQGGDAAV